MSDFFEMREALEQIVEAEERERVFHKRVYQFILVLVIGAGAGAHEFKHRIESPLPVAVAAGVVTK